MRYNYYMQYVAVGPITYSLTYIQSCIIAYNIVYNMYKYLYPHTYITEMYMQGLKM